MQVNFLHKQRRLSVDTRCLYTGHLCRVPAPLGITGLKKQYENSDTRLLATPTILLNQEEHLITGTAT